jgi:succinyl-diaminopimelate desuccinylase
MHARGPRRRGEPLRTLGPKGAKRSFGFNGHTDVVPPGDVARWRIDPFGGAIKDGFLWGRGAADMKSGVAAFVAAACAFGPRLPADGAILFAITGDEEGDATDGTVALLDWMRTNGEAMSVCVVGEPTSVAQLGDTVKIGRRGSLTGHLTVTGVQGHSAYPERARNPIPALAALVDRLSSHGSTRGPSISALDPGRGDDGHRQRRLERHPGRDAGHAQHPLQRPAHGRLARGWLRARRRGWPGVRRGVDLAVRVSGEAFLTPPGPLSDSCSRASEPRRAAAPAALDHGRHLGRALRQGALPGGGAGPRRPTMHQVDERVEAAQVEGSRGLRAHPEGLLRMTLAVA